MLSRILTGLLIAVLTVGFWGVAGRGRRGKCTETGTD